jgi:predicted peptidase
MLLDCIPEGIRMFRKLFHLALLAALVFLGYNEYAHLRIAKPPVYEKTVLFQKRYHFTAYPPFVDAYYLLTPLDYKPKYKYPVVLVLPGADEPAYGAFFLASDALRKSFPAFVVVPFTSVRSFWAAPANAAYRPALPGLHLPDAMPQAVEIIRGLEKTYSIDKDKIYVTGHGTGGMAAYGAIARYPDVFAASLPVAGLWDPAEAAQLRQRPIWAFHGATDKTIPPDADRQLDKALQKLGGRMTYTEIPETGADVWKRVYSEPGVWAWLFQRRLHGTEPAAKTKAKPAHKAHK